MPNNSDLAPVLYLPHGGGPLPVMGEPGHQKLTEFLTSLAADFKKPDAILVISAHWEADEALLTSAAQPSLLYDYYGFPDETYQITYPAPGLPALAEQVRGLLEKDKIAARLDGERGLDHGVFIPLKLIYPDADIPCVQLSLKKGLDPQVHIEMGRCLAPLRENNVLIIGSGLSFHNIRALMRPVPGPDEGNVAFNRWLMETCTDKGLSEAQRLKHLLNWKQAPFARYAHPREEHLLPLHVCYGVSENAARVVFNDTIMGKEVCGFCW